MRDKKPGSERRHVKPSPLTPEDRALWKRLSETIEQLPPSKSRGRVPLQSSAPSDGPSFKPRAEPLVDVSPRIYSLPPLPAVAKDVSGRACGPPPLAPFDRKRARALVTGKIAIEAKLDLHGLRQDEAFYRLQGFLRDCSARGLSTVIVVTGKGGVRPASGPQELVGYFGPERGILRRNLPMWLDQPDLRAIVASYAQASIRHGGDGAFYIHLRRRRPA